jgi:hypothetical protein
VMMGSGADASILEATVSDLGTLEDLSQSRGFRCSVGVSH